jgi:RNA polymerase sigma-70 factor (ECF subfamily)
MPDPSLELVDRARQGDKQVLPELFQLYEERLLRMVELRLDVGLRRRLDSADIVQDAWAEIVRRFDEWRRQDTMPLFVWMRLITAQALAGAQRRHFGAHMRDAQLEVPQRLVRAHVSSASVAEAFVDSATSPSQALVREELRQRVRSAIESLDEIDREIVALRHFEGLSNQDAAAELSIEPTTASKRYLRALVHLRPVLQLLAAEHGGSRA